MAASYIMFDVLSNNNEGTKGGANEGINRLRELVRNHLGKRASEISAALADPRAVGKGRRRS
jgi:hypothetical protein